MTNPWEQQGCLDCRNSAVGGMPQPLVLIEVNADEFASLWRCQKCKAYWVEEQRYSCEISESEARARFPSSFRPA